MLPVKMLVDPSGSCPISLNTPITMPPITNCNEANTIVYIIAFFILSGLISVLLVACLVQAAPQVLQDCQNDAHHAVFPQSVQ